MIPAALLLQKYHGASYKRVVIHDENEMSGAYKRRTIFVPNDDMRNMHAQIKHIIKTRLKAGYMELPSATAWIPKSSVKKHLLRHRTNNKFHRYWFVTDIKNAFPSVTRESVILSLATLVDMDGIKHSDLFVRKFFWTEHDGLLQGLPVSPLLFNLVAERWIDANMRIFCKRYEIVYTRYGDDLVFTSNKYISQTVRKELLGFVHRAGFKTGEKKTKFFDLHNRGSIILHGVGIRNMFATEGRFVPQHREISIRSVSVKKSELFIPKTFCKKIKGLLTIAVHGKGIDPRVIRGYMAILHSVGYKTNTRLLKEIDALYFTFRKMFPKPTQ